jgi:hypothetical protein
VTGYFVCVCLSSSSKALRIRFVSVCVCVSFLLWHETFKKREIRRVVCRERLERRQCKWLVGWVYMILCAFVVDSCYASAVCVTSAVGDVCARGRRGGGEVGGGMGQAGPGLFLFIYMPCMFTCMYICARYIYGHKGWVVIGQGLLVVSGCVDAFMLLGR